MSNLELLIKQCRKVWREMKVPLKKRDEMIDTLVIFERDINTGSYTTYAFDKVTDEGIKQATIDYLSQKAKDWDILKMGKK